MATLQRQGAQGPQGAHGLHRAPWDPLGAPMGPQALGLPHGHSPCEFLFKNYTFLDFPGPRLEQPEAAMVAAAAMVPAAAIAAAAMAAAMLMLPAPPKRAQWGPRRGPWSSKGHIFSLVGGIISSFREGVFPSQGEPLRAYYPSLFPVVHPTRFRLRSRVATESWARLASVARV